MTFDLVVRGGTVVDGTGAPPRRADVGVRDDRIVAIEERLIARGTREIDARDRVVTPGFVDIHTHLDAQLFWDPVASPSCWHGVTSVVIGNCGIGFAPCHPDDREVLAELMESVEDIPRSSILAGLPWDWVTFGDFLDAVDRAAKGLNVGALVGHCALRQFVMADRGLDETPAAPDEIAEMAAHLDAAMGAGALGFSTSRTLLHRVPDGRPVPGTWATPSELFAFADVLARHGCGVFGSASRLGEGDGPDLALTRAEVEWMGEVSRRSGRPVSFALAQSARHPDLFRRVIALAKEQNAAGADVRPQTAARGLAILFNLATRSPFDRAPAWRELRALRDGEQLLALRDVAFRQRLIDEADAHPSLVDLSMLFALPPNGPARYDCDPATSIAAIAARRGVSPAAAYIELLLETNGQLVCSYPFLNQCLDAVQEMLDDPLVTLGLADAGAHVSQIMDASQPTFLLTYWVREQQRWSLEEAVRRLTSDTAELFGLAGRGVLRPGAFADVNVIDWDGLALAPPQYVNDLPGGAGRYVQRATGYDVTVVNGEVFMEHGEHTGVVAGRLLRSTD